MMVPAYSCKLVGPNGLLGWNPEGGIGSLTQGASGETPEISTVSQAALVSPDGSKSSALAEHSAAESPE